MALHQLKKTELQLLKIYFFFRFSRRGTDIKLSKLAHEIGGLHVILTERHESRRVDRQLFGRCGRQGDPGVAESYISLQDDLFLRHLPKWLQQIANKLLTTRGQSPTGLEQWVQIQLFKYAQTKAERRAFQTRSSVLKVDEYHANILAFTGRLE